MTKNELKIALLTLLSKEFYHTPLAEFLHHIDSLLNTLEIVDKSLTPDFHIPADDGVLF